MPGQPTPPVGVVEDERGTEAEADAGAPTPIREVATSLKQLAAVPSRACCPAPTTPSTYNVGSDHLWAERSLPARLRLVGDRGGIRLATRESPVGDNALATIQRVGGKMPEKTRRNQGAWIGQRPDENTEKVRKGLDDGAERVAVTNNESAPPETVTESEEADEAR